MIEQTHDNHFHNETLAIKYFQYFCHLILTIIIMLPGISMANSKSNWPLWESYASRFIQEDGRVVDISGDFTTSEGQAYSLFFALVGNDRERFNLILNWTEENLAQGDLSARLPAWHWGLTENNEWGILDNNSASDSDLWISYTLIEAARLWEKPAYERLGQKLMQRVVKQEIRHLPGFGMMLLPGPKGFCMNSGLCRLNPSYLPIPILRRFSEYYKSDLWDRLAENTVYMIKSASSEGIVPDWIAYKNGQGFILDPINGDVGSYDAIRVYLWAGMLDSNDPLSSPLLSAISGLARSMNTRQSIPRILYSNTGEAEGIGPVGFSAAVLPYLELLGEQHLLDQQIVRVRNDLMKGLLGESPVYYDQNLALFGTGWFENRFFFDEQGRLIPDWH